jgi:ornithine cyclodeaminase/alanine dehydrogenase-like protein (mu-crystallin family)
MRERPKPACPTRSWRTPSGKLWMECGREAGDLIQAEHAGAFGWEDATQLEDALLWSNKPGGTIIFKSVGHALWDLAAARTAFGFRTPKSRR